MQLVGEYEGHDILVSIPQAVSTVATAIIMHLAGAKCIMSFNTASGKYCCNLLQFWGAIAQKDVSVSIPQAVSTVATMYTIIV